MPGRLPLILLGGLLLPACATVSAQALRGQVLMPDGSPATREIRIVMQDAESFRSQEIIYTDSNGRFTVITAPDGMYRFTITADSDDFQTSIFTEQVGRTNRYLVLSLRPPAGVVRPAEMELDASIPAEARKAYQRAVSQLKKNQSKRAEESLRAALAAHPDFFEARNDLGMVLLEAGRLSEAEIELAEASKLNPDDYRPRYNLGLAFLRQEKFEPAATLLRGVIEQRNDLANAHYYFGVASYGLENFDLAQQHLELAWNLDPNNQVEALMFLGNVHYLKGDLAQAIASFKQYLQVFPDAPNAAEVLETIKRLEKGGK